MKEVIFICPMYNAKPHLKELIESLQEQTNKNWRYIIIDDMSTDDSYEHAKKLTESDNRFEVRKNKEKCWALKNVIKVAREFENRHDAIIAIIDADDSLCNENTVDLILKEYNSNNLDSLWTAHTWDINGMNISNSLPEKINPYQYPWVSSHLKTFKAILLKEISDKNFKDMEDNWFERGYDQALYLPILFKSKSRKFLNEVCYLYRINSNSLKVRDWKEKNQMSTIKLIRSRGYVE